MALSSKEKVARHRAQVNADPVARANYLAKRRESYQKRKREEKTKHIPVVKLSKTKQEKMREKWREYQRNYRKNKRVLDDVLNLTPPSMNTSANEQIQHLENPEPMHNHLDDHDYEQPNLESPQASSTPTRKEKERKNKSYSSLFKERERLRSELRKVKRDLQIAKQKTQKIQRKLERQKKKQKTIRGKKQRQNENLKSEKRSDQLSL